MVSQFGRQHVDVPPGVDKKSNVFIILYTFFQVSPDIYGIYVTVWAFYGLFAGVRMAGRVVFASFRAGRPDRGGNEEAGKEGISIPVFRQGFLHVFRVRRMMPVMLSG